MTRTRGTVLLLSGGLLAAFTVGAGKQLLTSSGASEGSVDAGPGIVLVVHQVEDPFVSTADHSSAPGGLRWMAVDVEVRNHTSATTRVSGVLDLVVRDDLGWSYPAVFVQDELPPLAGRMPPDGSLRGTVVFQVPADTTGARLTMTSGHGQVLAEVALP